MRVVLNRALCDGNGLCAKEAPQLFALDQEDVLHVLKEHVDPAEESQARRAVGVCPKAALSLTEQV